MEIREAAAICLIVGWSDITLGWLIPQLSQAKQKLISVCVFFFCVCVCVCVFSAPFTRSHYRDELNNTKTPQPAQGPKDSGVQALTVDLKLLMIQILHHPVYTTLP